HRRTLHLWFGAPSDHYGSPATIKHLAGRPLMFSTSTHDTANLRRSPCPDPASGYDLLKAAALMWAHAMRFEWSISLAYKKFHLAPKMLLSNALWQPVTTLPTYFIALHIRPFRGQGCELICGLQHCRRKRKSTLLSLPVSKE